MRGKLLALVLEAGSVTEAEAAARTGEEPGRVKRILADLAREGFVAESDGTYTCR